MSYASLCTTADRFLDRTQTIVCDESIDMAGPDKAILNDVGVELLRCPAPAAGSPMKADALVNLPILAVSSASRSPRAPVQRTNGKGL